MSVIDINSRGVADIDFEEYVTEAKETLEDMIRRSRAKAVVISIVGAGDEPWSAWRTRVTMSPGPIVGAIEFTKMKVFRDTEDDVEPFPT